MAIATPGVGSGLDINGIVTQLLSIEKQPLKILQSQAQTLQTKLSLVAQLKSQLATLADSAQQLASAVAWAAKTVTSSQPGVALARLQAQADLSETSFQLEVQSLAQARSAVTAQALASNTLFGAGGNLQLQIGSKAPMVNGQRQAGDFVARAGTPAVNLSISASDTMSSIAAKINQAQAGVQATILRDNSGERLVMRSSQTGIDADFQVLSSGDPSLRQFEFNRNAAAPLGALLSPNPMVSNAAQQPGDSQFSIDGVAMTSGSNRLDSTLPGLSLELLQTSSSALSIKVQNDPSQLRSQLESLVKNYNSVNKLLNDATKYDAASKQGGSFQGDATLLGLQNAMRSLLGSSSGAGLFKTISSIGLQLQKDGSLASNSDKLASALLQLDPLKHFFVGAPTDPVNSGWAHKLKSFTQGLLSDTGQIRNKSQSLNTMSLNNSKEQERINDRVALTEIRLRKQYSALDANLGRLQALNAYVSQQVTSWNQSKN